MNKMMLDRRSLMGGAAAAMAATITFPRLADARPDLSGVPTRTTGKVEVLYKTPHFGPNGMWLSDEGMWIIHQIPANYASLIDLSNGRLIREVQCEGVVSASGICIDEEGVMWIGSTYNSLIIACDAQTGKAIAKYSTPGAGQIYSMKGDVRGNSSPLEAAYPPPPPPPGGTGGRQGAGRQDISVTRGPIGTGPHCPLPKGNLLFVDVPPARMIFSIDKATWQVQQAIPTAGDRPHDMVWADDAKTRIWCSDSNYNSFFLHDVASERILERVDLPEGSPIIHGAKLKDGYMYMCDDRGWMSRVRFSA